MIVDPTNQNNALDTDGELMSAVRIAPIVENLAAPTLTELLGAPIIGYARPDALTAADNEPLPSTFNTATARSMTFKWKPIPEP